MDKKEVKVYVNTRPYGILSVKRDKDYVEIYATERIPVMFYCCKAIPKDISTRCLCKKFTASINYRNDGCYANIYSDELYFDEEGELHYKPRKAEQ